MKKERKTEIVFQNTREIHEDEELAISKHLFVQCVQYKKWLFVTHFIVTGNETK